MGGNAMLYETYLRQEANRQNGDTVQLPVHIVMGIADYIETLRALTYRTNQRASTEYLVQCLENMRWLVEYRETKIGETSVPDIINEVIRALLEKEGEKDE